MKQLSATLALWRASLQGRWLAMPTRDQRALALLVVFVVSLGGWFGVVTPVLDLADEAREAHAQAQADLAWMQANAQAARQASARGGQIGAGQSLLSAVNSSARSSGLNLQRFEPDGEQRVRVTLEGAVFVDVMRWLVLLQQQYGLDIVSFHADPQTQPGIVNVRLTVGRPS